MGRQGGSPREKTITSQERAKVGRLLFGAQRYQILTTGSQRTQTEEKPSVRHRQIQQVQNLIHTMNPASPSTGFSQSAWKSPHRQEKRDCIKPTCPWPKIGIIVVLGINIQVHEHWVFFRSN